MKAHVLSNQCIKGPYYKLVIKPVQKIAYTSGQFLMIRPSDSASSGIFLPRPFSIHSLTEENHLSILYKVVGRGTEFFSRLEAGNEIECLGPFGNGFQLDPDNPPDKFIIVAGGIGVAPLVSLTELIRSTFPEAPIKAFLGGRGIMDLLCIDELGKSGADVVVATEDGSSGVKGYVTDALEAHLRKVDPNYKIAVYSCGPNPMLRRIYEIVSPLNIQTFVSLEANMACGMGLCMGCAVRKRSGGYYLVCKDGPVFNGDAIEISD